MCTQIHIVYTIYKTILKWTEGEGVVYEVCRIILLFSIFHIQKGFQVLQLV